MNFVKSLDLLHVAAKEIPCLTGQGAPTADTDGAPGVLYMDTDTGALYKCRGGSEKAYIWESAAPVKGVDYFTEADKAEITAAVVEALGGSAVFGYVDEQNNIIISGLANGSYSVKYEMADGSTVDIGHLELDLNVYHSIANNLTNCVSSNSAVQAVGGARYDAAIAANSGYELKSVVVTMGGADISATAVSGGTISIAEVTGSIVITAVAEAAVVVDPTNFFDVNGDGLVDGGRLGSDGGLRTDGGPDCLLSNYIAVQSGDVVFIENADVYSTLSSGLYGTDKAKISVFTSAGSSDITANNTTSGQQQFTVANTNAGYVRLCIKPSASIKVNGSGANATARYDLSQIVVKIKRDGAWL